jgi:signal transduction histidine kinase
VVERERPLVPSAWPLYVALGVVVALAAANVVTDLIEDAKIESLTADTVNNALRSVGLIDDLRGQAHRLVGPIADDELAQVREAIERDARSYEQLAWYPGEHAEWEHLRGVLDQLQRTESERLSPLHEVDASIDRIANIDQMGAAHDLDAVRRTQHRTFVISFISGLIVFGAAGVVMVVISRLLRNQRMLIARQFEVAIDRQRDLEAFAGRVAHDLRNPLAPLRLGANMLAENPANLPKVADRIVRKVDEMAAIIDSLLALSSSGRPEPGTTKISPVIAEALEQHEAALRGAQVAVSAPDCTVACSATVLRQIVSNLLTNASKYRAPERELQVSITVVCENGFAELTVADNGIGMDEATASHVFEPLYRAETVRRIPGHGLGLAIVGRTVQALNGTYSVTSSPGAGSKFVIRLPLAIESSAPAGPHVAEAH